MKNHEKTMKNHIYIYIYIYIYILVFVELRSVRAHPIPYMCEKHVLQPLHRMHMRTRTKTGPIGPKNSKNCRKTEKSDFSQKPVF